MHSQDKKKIEKMGKKLKKLPWDNQNAQTKSNLSSKFHLPTMKNTLAIKLSKL